MPTTFRLYKDASLTVEFNPASDTVGPVSSSSPTDFVLYLGSTASGHYAEADSDPGVDPIVVSITDATPGSGAVPTEVQLATTAPGLDSATGGAPLSLGTQIDSGVINAAKIHIRVEHAGGATGDTDLKLEITTLLETGNVAEWGASTVGAHADLASWYKFNEASGTLVDSAGSDDGTPNGTPTYQRPGLLPDGADESLGFNGAAGNFVSLGGTAHAYERTDAFTFSCWFNGTTTGGSQKFFVRQGVGPAFQGMQVAIIPTGKIVLDLIADNSTSNYLRVSTDSTSYLDGSDHQLDVTYDGSSTAAGVTIYIDGAAVATTADHDNLSASIVATADASIGGTTSGTAVFNGDLDEVRIYTAELSAAEVAELYTWATGGDTTETISPDPYATIEVDTRVLGTLHDEIEYDSAALYWRRNGGGTLVDEGDNPETLSTHGSPTAGTAMSTGQNGSTVFTSSDGIYADMNAALKVQAFTVVMVVKLSSATTPPGCLLAVQPRGLYPHAFTPRGGYQINANGAGKITFQAADGSSTAAVQSTLEIRDDLSHMIVATYDGATMRLYIDKNEQGSGAALSSISYTDNTGYPGPDPAAVFLNGYHYRDDSGQTPTFDLGGMEVDVVAIHVGGALSAARIAEYDSVAGTGAPILGSAPAAALPMDLVGKVSFAASTVPMQLEGVTGLPMRLQGHISASPLPVVLQGFIDAPAATLPAELIGQLQFNASEMFASLSGTVETAANTLPARLRGMAATSGSTLGMRLEAPNPTHYGAVSARWGVQVLLDGTDISAQITGPVRLQKERNASNLADFDMIPAAGAVSLDDYERKRVVIRYEERDATGAVTAAVTRYTGTTSKATYDPDSGVLSVRATTNTQGRFENMSRSAIAGVVGGLWSEHVFDDKADGWQYAQDRAATAEVDFYVNDYGGLVTKPWAAGSPVSTFTDSNRFGNTLTLERVSARDLVTRVVINFDFRYVLLRHREMNCIFVNSLGLCGYLGGQGKLPSKSVITQAADGNPWTRITPISFTDLPPPGTYCSGANFTGDVDKRLCLSASWKAARRWAQTVTEEYEITVVCEDLEEAIGTQPSPLAYEIEAAYDASDYEKTLDFDSPPTGATLNAITQDYQLEADAATRTGRAALADAQECAIAFGRSIIRGRARENRVAFEPVYDPTVTLGDTRAVDTLGLDATGVVWAIDEELNVNSGALTMRVELALSRHGGSGLATDDPVTAPTKPDQPAETPTPRTYYMLHKSGGVTGSAPDSEDFEGWLTNAYGGARTDPSNLYRERFVVKMPEIEESARDAVAAQKPATYSVTVPEDPLTMSY